MNNSGIISWQGEQVGMVTNITSDMWYLDAGWEPISGNSYLKFNEIAAKLNAKNVINDFTKGMVATLSYTDMPANTQYVLILSLDEEMIFMRTLDEVTAAYIDLNILRPWQQIENPQFYENELKKEIGILHPLFWKKVTAIGKRSDRDDVLFEVTGARKYAVVHLSYKKEYSRTFPVTHLYQDWTDLFKNRLLQEHRDWQNAAS